MSPLEEAPARLEGKYVAIVVCWLLGNGCLFSWNSMLTIEDYYVRLFPRYHPSRVLTLVYQPFALGTLAILAYNEAKINTRKRNLFGYGLFFISSLLVLVLDLATSGKGGIGTFIGICAMSGAFGLADAHVQGGMVGDLSFMTPELVQSFLAGLAASGALTSTLRLITKAAFENSANGFRKGAILFFSIATFLSSFALFSMPSEGSKTVSSDLAAAGIQTLPEETDKQFERLSNKELLLQNVDYAIDMFLIYVLTLSIFPGFLSEDTGSHSLGTWYALVLIAMYNVGDLIGRYIPLVKFLKLESRKGLMVAVLSRFLLIPAFYFTAKYGEQGWMIMLTSVLGLTNGYLTVCVLTSAPKGYKGPEQNALGNLLVLFLLGGIFAGVTLDWLWLIGKGWSLVSAVLMSDNGAWVGDRNCKISELDLATFGKGEIGTFIGICAISGAFRLADAHVQGGMVGDLSFMTSELVQANKQFERLSNKELLLQNVDYAIDMFLIYVLILSIFPRFVSKDTGSHSLLTWYALVLIAMYNVRDLIGRYISLVKFLKLESRKGLMVAVLSRFLLIPSFYFMAKYGYQGWMIMLTSVLGLTNGYLTICVLTSAPKGYKGPEQNALGNLLVLFLLGGLFAGVTLDWLWLIGKGWSLVSAVFMSDNGASIGIETAKLVNALFHGQILWLWMDDNANVGLGFNKRLLHRLCPYAPKGYKGPEQNALGNLLVLFLSEGIFVGVILNWLWLIGKGW
ncbi:hypothetical protein LWI28_013291 [Acer negundo]|uniref:Uncharacterized protein n=1 Tax=Acer negundo TaxID=4023 RepID=A0AAD5ITZ0_ACENE|nr:hypothetical protein LWI28_013291 [Acer negundo]